MNSSQTTQGTAVTPNPGEHQAYHQKKVIFRTYQVIWYILGVIEILLGARILLKFLAANPNSSFVNLVYSLSNPFALPFSGIFGVTQSRGSVLEWSTFVAMTVFAVVAFGIVKLIKIAKPVSPEEVHETVDHN